MQGVWCICHSMQPCIITLCQELTLPRQYGHAVYTVKLFWPLVTLGTFHSTEIPVWNFGNFTCPMERYILVARVGYCSLDCKQLSFARKSVSERILAARSRELRGRKFAARATLLLKYCRSKIFEQKRDCSKSNRSWKRDIKERYWGQQLCQMERDISVRLSEMTRPVKVDHHQSWSRIFRSDQTEICPFHLT